MSVAVPERARALSEVESDGDVVASIELIGRGGRDEPRDVRGCSDRVGPKFSCSCSTGPRLLLRDSKNCADSSPLPNPDSGTL